MIGYSIVLKDFTEYLYRENPDRWIEDYTRSLNNLGFLYSNIGKTQEAEELYKEAIEIMKKAYEKNPDRWNKDYTN